MNPKPSRKSKQLYLLWTTNHVVLVVPCDSFLSETVVKSFTRLSQGTSQRKSGQAIRNHFDHFKNRILKRARPYVLPYFKGLAHCAIF